MIQVGLRTKLNYRIFNNIDKTMDSMNNWCYDELDGDSSPRPSVRVGGSRSPAPTGVGSWLQSKSDISSRGNPSSDVGSGYEPSLAWPTTSVGGNSGVKDQLRNVVQSGTGLATFTDDRHTVSSIPPPITDPFGHRGDRHSTPPAPTTTHPMCELTPNRPTNNRSPPPVRRAPPPRRAPNLSDSRAIKRNNRPGPIPIMSELSETIPALTAPPNFGYHNVMKKSIDGVNYLSLPAVFSHVSMGGRLSIHDRISLGEFVKKHLHAYYPNECHTIGLRDKIRINSAWNPVVGSTEEIKICHYMWEDYPLVASACLLWFHSNKSNVVY